MAVTTGFAAGVAALEALEGRGIKLGLERTLALLRELGDPQQALRGTLIAGTNGKGSVAALVESMARAAGLSTVLLTKPHLVSWRERIALDGSPVSEELFAELIEDCLRAAAAVDPEQGPPTLFEVITAAGILAATRHRPDVVVCEVGLGGRLDSTNVLDLGVAVITNIALDHTRELGADLSSIAAEKAGIIKPGSDVVTGAVEPALTVIREAAGRAGTASFTDAGALGIDPRDRGAAGAEVTVPGLHLTTPLIGAFQAHNLAVAAVTARALAGRGYPITDDAIVRGAASVRWPGRMQWFDGTPPVLVDGCHNTAAVAAMVSAALPLADGRRTAVVFGAMADKDIDPMLAALRPLPHEVVFTAPAGGRAADPHDLARRWHGNSTVAPTVAVALDTARERAGPSGVVVACGSLYVAGEVLAALAREGVATGLPP